MGSHLLLKPAASNSKDIPWSACWREISREQVKLAVLKGSIIEEYPDDSPYPSALFLGWFEGQPLHVVVAYDFHANRCYIITAYVPDLEHFEPDYKTRR